MLSLLAMVLGLLALEFAVVEAQNLKPCPAQDKVAYPYVKYRPRNQQKRPVRPLFKANLEADLSTKGFGKGKVIAQENAEATVNNKAVLFQAVQYAKVQNPGQKLLVIFIKSGVSTQVVNCQRAVNNKRIGTKVGGKNCGEEVDPQFVKFCRKVSFSSVGQIAAGAGYVYRDSVGLADAKTGVSGVATTIDFNVLDKFFETGTDKAQSQSGKGKSTAISSTNVQATGDSKGTIKRSVSTGPGFASSSSSVSISTGR